MPLAAKGAWEVRAGIIPGQAMPELTRRWVYTSADREKDETESQLAAERSATAGLAYHAIFAKMRAEAVDYHLQMSNPRVMNWAELTFIWY